MTKGEKMTIKYRISCLFKLLFLKCMQKLALDKIQIHIYSRE